MVKYKMLDGLHVMLFEVEDGELKIIGRRINLEKEKSHKEIQKSYQERLKRDLGYDII